MQDFRNDWNFINRDIVLEEREHIESTERHNEEQHSHTSHNQQPGGDYQPTLEGTQTSLLSPHQYHPHSYYPQAFDQAPTYGAPTLPYQDYHPYGFQSSQYNHTLAYEAPMLPQQGSYFQAPNRTPSPPIIFTPIEKYLTPIPLEESSLLEFAPQYIQDEAARRVRDRAAASAQSDPTGAPSLNRPPPPQTSISSTPVQSNAVEAASSNQPPPPQKRKSERILRKKGT